MEIANTVAKKSTCCRQQVAAIIVKDNRIISTGYNGTPRGLKNCNEGGCPRCNSSVPHGTALDQCICCHAEESSILNAAFHGIATQGATMYTTLSPCLLCAKMIINAGIVEVIYQARFVEDKMADKMLKEAGVTIRPVEQDA
jgi:dCMP deaminase